jgi:UDP-N-acetylglucosamine 2-epimerase (non-hydrolysing)
LQENKYFVVSAHREENVDSPKNMQDMLKTLNALAAEYGFPVIVSTHPRTQKKLDSMEIEEMNPLIKFLKPFGFCDYIWLQMKSLCVVSDSGTISEEASMLNLPAITIRNSHERPEAMDEGTFIMSGLTHQKVSDAVKVVIDHHSDKTTTLGRIGDYESGNVSKKILRVVMSYIDYVNRTVWSK